MSDNDASTPSVNPNASQPNPATPPAAAVLAGNVAPTPDASQLPINSRPPVQAPQVDPVMAHHSLLGAAAHKIKDALEGRETVNFQRGEDGSLQPITEPRKPGGIFRDILLGAMLGGSAAAQAPRGSGPVGGFATGAVAGMKVKQNREANLKNDFLQKEQDQHKTAEHNLAAATFAQDTVSTLEMGHHINSHTPDEISRHEKSASTVQDQLLNNGAAMAHIPGPNGEELNGEKGNGPAFMKMFNADPTNFMDAGSGYHRVPFVSYDLSNVKYVPGTGYVNSDGSPADMNEHTSVTLVDVPTAMWNKTLNLDAGVLNDVAGYPIIPGGKTGKKAAVTVGSLLGLGLKNKQDLNKARRELMTAPKDENEALQRKSEADTINSDPNATDAEKHRAGIQGPMATRWLANQAAQKAAQTKAGQENKPPATIDAATSAWTAAQQAYASSPTDANKKAVDNAKQMRDNLIQAKVDELKATYNEQINLARGKANVEKQAKEDYDRGTYALLSQGDPLGWKPKSNQYMSEQEFNKAKDKFASGTLAKAQDTEKSYGMFQNAYGEFQAAQAAGKKLPTGAQSMVALSTHLGTTFGNVKGSRITKDMIKEHLGARSISDDALVATQKLTNGDVLSPAQWKAFGQMISESRNLTWDNTATNAHYIGLPADFLPADYVAAKTKQSSQNVQPPSQPVQTGFVRIQASDGFFHDIPSGNLAGAKQIDPKLKVIGQ